MPPKGEGLKVYQHQEPSPAQKVTGRFKPSHHARNLKEHDRSQVHDIPWGAKISKPLGLGHSGHNIETFKLNKQTVRNCFFVSSLVSNIPKP